MPRRFVARSESDRMKSFRALLLILLACALLSACGNKGDLVRPTPTDATTDRATAGA